MNDKSKYYWLFITIPLFFVVWFFVSKNNQQPLRKLPYFGQKKTIENGEIDYHRVKPFFFTNQHNETVTEETVKGKVYVTDFFFTTCQSICPIMSTQLERVYKKYENKQDVLILSHTVEPEVDSVIVLKKYANVHGVKDNRWHFLTGDKKQLYDMARTGYLLNNEKGSGGNDDFIHTQNFALVDKERHIRGFYDGTDTADVSRLILEINLLLQEYDSKTP